MPEEKDSFKRRDFCRPFSPSALLPFCIFRVPSLVSMNEKASVSKELNAKHKKDMNDAMRSVIRFRIISFSSVGILEGLLKLPENRECADCKANFKYQPDSLGVKKDMLLDVMVRLDGSTMGKCKFGNLHLYAVFWYPQKPRSTHFKALAGQRQSEQYHTVGPRGGYLDALATGNEKSNSYWEAELPPNYDRVGIENFIRAKYEEKRWVPREPKSKSPSRTQDEKASVPKQRTGDRVGHGHTNSVEYASEERKKLIPAKIQAPIVAKVSDQVKLVSSTTKVDTVVVQADATQKTQPTVSAPPPPPPPKVDYAADLFNMLSMAGPSENGPESSSADDYAWAGFQSAETTNTTEKVSSEKPAESKAQSTPELEDLFKDSPSTTQLPVSANSMKDVKNDIMGLFEKSNMVSPFSVRQQQLAFLAQQQSLLMAAAAKSGSAAPSYPGKSLQPGSKDAQAPGGGLPAHNWPNLGFPLPGMMMPAGGQNDLQKHMQARILELNNESLESMKQNFSYFLLSF
ncbi:hypothetical protein ACLOJK_015204 [Asimina triloba]